VGLMIKQWWGQQPEGHMYADAEYAIGQVFSNLALVSLPHAAVSVEQATAGALHLSTAAAQRCTACAESLAACSAPYVSALKYLQCYCSCLRHPTLPPPPPAPPPGGGGGGGGAGAVGNRAIRGGISCGVAVSWENVAGIMRDCMEMDQNTPRRLTGMTSGMTSVVSDTFHYYRGPN
jgi:hypothetical protein